MGLVALLGACTQSPSVTLLSPADGDTVCGEPLVVELDVVGVKLLDPYAGVDAPGAAHVDLALNGQDAAMTGEERVEITRVVDGLYLLSAELSGADHLPLEGAVSDEVQITVAATACAAP